MGSYLTIYAKSRNTGEMYSIGSFRTSSSELYQVLRENTNIACSEKYDEELHQAVLSDDYTKLTSEILSDCAQDLQDQITKSTNRINIAYKISGKVSIEDAVMEIAQDEEYLEELKTQLSQILFLSDLVYQSEQKWSDVEGFYMQVG